jgi:hypothetical protein
MDHRRPVDGRRRPFATRGTVAGMRYYDEQTDRDWPVEEPLARLDDAGIHQQLRDTA